MQSNRRESSDQSASMGRNSEDENGENEADNSFLDDDFLSFAPQENGSKNATSAGRKRSRSNSPVPNGSGKRIAVPWLGENDVKSAPQRFHGRGYSGYSYEPPALVKLHNEIVSFVKLMEPTRDELKVRERMVERVTELAERTFGKNCHVLPFGSQVTGLCLPNSDIDFVIRFPQNSTSGKSKSSPIDLETEESYTIARSNPLHAFAKTIRDEFGILSESNTNTTKEHLSYLEVIEQTRVPLVKFTLHPYNLDIDICFDQPGGPESAELMHRFMNRMPPLRPLTFVLKYFLASRDINKPFTGGIGSYLLQLMIVSFLQNRFRDDYHRTRRTDHSYNLGSLLVDFFELYGVDLNYYTTGISVNHDGSYFAKGDRDRKDVFYQPGRPFSLAMENPLDGTMDVGAGAYRMQMIQRVFDHSYKTLLAYVAEPREPTDSILARIIPPTEEMEERRLQKLAIKEKEAKERWSSPKKRKADKRDSDVSNGSKKKSQRDKDRWAPPKKKNSGR